jgi:hypothetical protein
LTGINIRRPDLLCAIGLLNVTDYDLILGSEMEQSILEENTKNGGIYLIKLKLKTAVAFE